MSTRTRLRSRPAATWNTASAVILAAAAAGGGVSACASGPGTSPRSRPASVRPLVTIGKFTGWAPSQIDFSADGGNVVTGIRWSSWTTAGATGRGKSGIESCVPNCAAGKVATVPATITLSAPRDGRFTMLTETRAGQTMTLRYPSSWPLAAS
ncbi:MAG TPA: hypothetical protein VG164_11060 [Trebonia sp.]|nr:hypothetical protein [Trebonia sp.]